jgi:glycosyltransferase involved in cell wall biosynthesis
LEEFKIKQISAIIITLNEERNIARCLASLDFVAEIVVVDSGSSDGTEAICRAHPKVRYFPHAWEGFGRQKNYALDQARSEWVFSIDADEVVTPELAREIQSLVTQPAALNGYTINRKNFYRQQWIRYSGWWPDRIVRLFRREQGRFSDRLVHEIVDVVGPVGKLAGCLEHHPFTGPSDFLRKCDSYSTLGAKMLLERGKKTSALRALVKSSFTFFKVLVIKRGILDGTAGVLIAYSNAAGVFYRHIKCREMWADLEKKGKNEAD